MALGKGLNSLIPQKNEKKTFDINTHHSFDKKDSIWHIPLSEIVPNSEQPRKDFSHKAMQELIDSIKIYGVMQPITVIERNDGGYEIIAGERRFRASKMAGLATIPAIVRTATEQEKLELALIENIQRQDLNPIEEAFSYKRLTLEFKLTQEKVAERVGKSRSQVANLIRLLDLPEKIQQSIIDGSLSVGKARALLSLPDVHQQLEMYASMMGDGLSTREVEREVQVKQGKKRISRRDPNILALEAELEAKFGTKVFISQSGEKGKITFEYYSFEELKELLENLKR